MTQSSRARIGWQPRSGIGVDRQTDREVVAQGQRISAFRSDFLKAGSRQGQADRGANLAVRASAT